MQKREWTVRRPIQPLLLIWCAVKILEDFTTFSDCWTACGSVRKWKKLLGHAPNHETFPLTALNVYLICWQHLIFCLFIYFAFPTTVSGQFHCWGDKRSESNLTVIITMGWVQFSSFSYKCFFPLKVVLFL